MYVKTNQRSSSNSLSTLNSTLYMLTIQWHISSHINTLLAHLYSPCSTMPLPAVHSLSAISINQSTHWCTGWGFQYTEIYLTTKHQYQSPINFEHIHVCMWLDGLVVSALDQQPRGRGFESAGCRLSCSNSCSLHPGHGLTQPSILSGSVNEYRLTAAIAGKV